MTQRKLFTHSAIHTTEDVNVGQIFPYIFWKGECYIWCMTTTKIYTSLCSRAGVGLIKNHYGTCIHSSWTIKDTCKSLHLVLHTIVLLSKLKLRNSWASHCLDKTVVMCLHGIKQIIPNSVHHSAVYTWCIVPFNAVSIVVSEMTLYIGGHFTLL